SKGRRGWRQPSRESARRGNSSRSRKNPSARNSNASRCAMARQFEGLERAWMPENGRRELGENVRMGLKMDATKEMEVLKRETVRENPAAGELANAGDSIGISLLDLAEILDQHKIWVESGGESGVKA